MEIAKIEVLMVEDAAAEALEANVRELNDLELSIVGGGCAEPSFR